MPSDLETQRKRLLVVDRGGQRMGRTYEQRVRLERDPLSPWFTIGMPPKMKQRVKLAALRAQPRRIIP